MNRFFKDISIYGMLPLIGKFIGFFLVPIYTRVFSSSEFGRVELVITFISFLNYFISLELNMGVGRYFYQEGTHERQKRLISTGLWMITLSSVVVVGLACLFQDTILKVYFNDFSLRNLLLISFIWLFFDGVLSYVNVIPRYLKKAKLYVIYNAIAILVRVLSTIFYILVLKVGIVGIIYGQITGSIVNLLLNGYISKEFFGFYFDLNDAKKIFAYSIPLVPAIIIAGAWEPTLRKLTELYLTYTAVGLLAFASRITSLTVMFRTALMSAWRPLMFEKMKDNDFLQEVRKNSSLIGLAMLSSGCIFVLFAPELCLIIGTKEYYESYQLIPFLCLAGYLQAEIQLRGFGPLINDKTYVQSVILLISIISASNFMVLIKDSLNLYGVGITIVLFEAIQYILLYCYTLRTLKDKFKGLTSKKEYALFAVLVVSSLLTLMQTPVEMRIIVGIMEALAFFIIGRKIISGRIAL